MNSLKAYQKRKITKHETDIIFDKAKWLLSTNGNRLACILGCLFCAMVILGGYYLSYAIIMFRAPILTTTGPEYIYYADYIGFAVGCIFGVPMIIGLKYAVTEGTQTCKINLADMFAVFAFGKNQLKFIAPIVYNTFRIAGVWAILSGWIFHGHYMTIKMVFKILICIVMILFWLYITRMSGLFVWMKLADSRSAGKNLIKYIKSSVKRRTARRLSNRLIPYWLLFIPTLFIHTVAVTLPLSLVSKALLCRYIADELQND